MGKRTAPLIPATEALLQRLGERLRLARLRRRVSASQVAERAGMTRVTLRAVERGAPGATFGAYAAVMQVLGVERDLELVASADPLGRDLQDARLEGGRGRRRAKPVPAPNADNAMQESPRMTSPPGRMPRSPGVRELAALIKGSAVRRKAS